MNSIEQLLTQFDPETGRIGNAPMTQRYLSDLRGCFFDEAAFERALGNGDPLVYTVAAVEPGSGEGDLHYGIGVIYPGRIGDEYYLTKGHLHAWRPAAEFYIGLRGEGVMLLEDEASGESRMEPLKPNHAVYVPGRTAHRTMNTGSEPLVYLGVYPGRAGHDYGAIAERNFRCVVVERNGRPAMIDREKL
jgi:glucose-6-phosphate isomerase